MNGLPLDLIDEILFKLDPKSLAIMGCMNKYFKSHIFEDPYFEINYFSHIGSSFILSYSREIRCMSISSGKSEDVLEKNCYILDSCSGLLLLDKSGLLFVVNPLTKRFRLIDHSWSKIRACTIKSIGFLAERNRTIQRFKIVCILEKFGTYGFEISDGDSWRLSKTTIIPDSKSELLMTKSVYLDNTFHWLRHDGSIIAFNLETEQAYLIPSSFELGIKRFFAADDKINRITLILETRETISIYILVENSKWTLGRQIKNVSVEKCRPEYRDVVWEVVVYDGKQLVVEEKKLNGDVSTKVHVYDMEANSWRVLGSTEHKGYGPWYYHKFTPSWFSMKNEHDFMELVVSDDKRMSNLADVIKYINTHSCGSC